MNPSAPSQPPLNEAYEQPSNPSAKNPDEAFRGNSTSASLRRSDPETDRREPGDLRDSVTGNEGGQGGEGGFQSNTGSLGYGATGSEARKGDRDFKYGGEVSNTEGEQMRAAGDGEIAKAQETKTGFGEQGDLASDLDRKKEEQQEIKESRNGGGNRNRGNGGGVDVGKALGGNVVSGGGTGASGEGYVDSRDLE